MTPEGRIRKYLKKAAKGAGLEHRKLKWIARNGAPDEFIFHPDRIIPSAAFIEVKAPGEVPEPHQDREIGRLRKAGFQVYVVDSELTADLVVSLIAGESTNRLTGASASA